MSILQVMLLAADGLLIALIALNIWRIKEMKRGYMDILDDKNRQIEEVGRERDFYRDCWLYGAPKKGQGTVSHRPYDRW